LEFWEHIERLTEEKMDKINDSYLTLDEELQKSARRASYTAAFEIMGYNCRYAWCAANNAANYRHVFAYATYELIANMDNKILYNLVMNP
jgi:hypothetical protein